MILKKVKNEIGATAIEYGILSSLIAVTTITGLHLTGVKLDNTYCYIATKVSEAVGGAGGGGCSSSTPVKSGANGPGSSSDAISPADLKNPSDLNTEFDFVNRLARYGIVSLTGIYGSDGHPIKTVKDLETYVGFTQKTQDELNTYLKYGQQAQDYGDAYFDEEDDVQNTGKQFYTPDPQNSTMTNSKGIVYYGGYSVFPDTNYKTIQFDDGKNDDNSQVAYVVAY